MSGNLSGINMERRRFQRFSLEIEIHYQCLKKASQSNLQTTQTKDIGAGGLAMYTNDKLEKNQMLMLTLVLPSEANEAESSSQNACLKTFILAKVVWNKSFDAKSHLHGIQFIDLKQEDRSRLRRFLLDYPQRCSDQN